jgi:DNA-binding transcriptional regulator YiaG
MEQVTPSELWVVYAPWSGAAFRNWRKALRLKQDEAATLLGVTRRTVVNWEAGDTPIPPMAVWACRYLAEHLEPVQVALNPPAVPA